MGRSHFAGLIFIICYVFLFVVYDVFTICLKLCVNMHHIYIYIYIYMIMYNYILMCINVFAYIKIYVYILS